jgi:hypothetical protein
MLCKLALLSVLSLSCGCQRQPRPQSTVVEPAFKKPTATEAFNLRTKCAELAEKISSEHDHAGISLALAQKRPPTPLTQEQFSNYDPKTNRCYVELRVTPALGFLMMLSKGNAKALKIRDDFFDAYEVDYMERHLYDGQTGHELASMQKGLKKVASSGFVKETKVEWFEASIEIDKLIPMIANSEHPTLTQ